MQGSCCTIISKNNVNYGKVCLIPGYYNFTLYQNQEY